MPDYLNEGPSDSPSPTNQRSSRSDARLRAEAELALLNRVENRDSLSSISRRLKIPLSTLRDWNRKLEPEAMQDPRSPFFLSPVGRHFLWQLEVLLHLHLGSSAAGSRVVSRILQDLDLRCFIGCSPNAQNEFAKKLWKAVGAYGDEEEARLAKDMETLLVCLAMDETFFKETLGLIAIDLVSGYHLTEVYSEDRRQETWQKANQPALERFNVEPFSVTSDQAKALIKHIELDIGVQQSPDLFHVTQDCGKAVVQPLARRTSQAAKKLKELRKDLENKRSDRGRRALEIEIAKQESLVKSSQELSDQARESQKGINESYHPVDLKTGDWLSRTTIEEKIEANFEKLEELAQRGKLSEKQRSRLGKAKRVLPAMLAYLSYFFDFVEVLARNWDLSGDKKQAWLSLVSAKYVGLVAERDRTDQKKRLKGLAQTLEEKALRSLEQTFEGTIEAAQLESMIKEALCLAQLFQRSSSAVEGRNSWLSLWRHGQKRISPQKWHALKVLRNFWQTKPDGTTAAERFFGRKPRDLKEYLWEHMPQPPAAAKRRKPQHDVRGVAA